MLAHHGTVGEYLQKWLDDNDVSKDTLVTKNGLTEEQVDGILDGTVHVDAIIASFLERQTGVPMMFWENYQKDCDDNQ